MGPLKNFVSNLTRGEFPVAVALFSAGVFLCVTYYTFHPSYRVNFHALYTVGVLFASFVAAASALFFAPTANDSKINKQNLLIGLLAFAFGLALGLYRLDYFDIWLDEEVQAFSTTQWPGYTIVNRAASSHQMPLGYFVTALNWDLVGRNEWGLRLFSCLFIAASGVLFFRLAKLLCSHRLLYTFAPFIYLMNPWLIRYSQEGRPYGLIMFTGLLWLNAVHDLFFKPEGRAKLLQHSLTTFTCTLIFLLSASFQPIILCGSLLVTLTPLIYFTHWRRRVGELYASVILALLAIVPLFLLARAASTHYFITPGGAESWRRVMQTLMDFPRYAEALFLGQAYFLALVFLFAPLTLLQQKHRTAGVIWVGLASCVVFGLSFLTPFSLLINYPIFVRYFMVLYPLGLLLIILYFDQLSTYFEGIRNRYFKWGWQLVFLAALMAPSLRALPDVYNSKKFDRWNVDYKAIYHFFQQTGFPGDVGYIIPYGNPGMWEQNGFLGTDYYYPQNWPVRVTSFRRTVMRETVTNLILADLPNQNPQQIFLTFLDLQGKDLELVKSHCQTQIGTEPLVGERHLICKVFVKDGFANSLERFFTSLIAASAEKQKAFRIFDILLHMAEHEKNTRKCLALHAKLKSLNNESDQIINMINAFKERCIKPYSAKKR